MKNVHGLMSDTGLKGLVTFLQRAGYAFITPTPATHRRVNARAGNETAHSLAGAFGWNRPFLRSLLPQSLFDQLKDHAVIIEGEAGWKSVVRASTLQGDVFLHSSYPTLSADAVFFGPDTYRFARAIRNHLRSEPRPLRRALDIGSGSGAGGVVIAKHARCHELVLTDINDTALQFAHLNARSAGVSNVSMVHSDLFCGVEGQFDLIVANPPYLNDALKRTYRHGGGELGSELSVRIAQTAKERLAPSGSLVLCTGSPIVGGVDRLLQAIEQSYSGSDLQWSYEEVDPDVFGEELETDAYNYVDRIAAVTLTARKSGAHAC